MSSDLYARCIFWNGARGGRAKHDGVDVCLHRAPSFGKLAPRLVEFAPEVHIFRLAESDADAPRDMTAAEISDAEWWLVNMAAKVREFTG